MTCKDYNNLEGCGKCKITLSDFYKLRKLSTISIGKVVDQLLGFCTSNTDKKLILEESTLTCTGNINISYKSKKKRNYLSKNRRTCAKFINFWSDYHQPAIYESIVFIYLRYASFILSSVNSESELCKEITNLDNMMEQLLKALI